MEVEGIAAQDAVDDSGPRPGGDYGPRPEGDYPAAPDAPPMADLSEAAARERAWLDSETAALLLTFVNGQPTTSPYLMAGASASGGRRAYVDTYNRSMGVAVGRHMREYMDQHITREPYAFPGGRAVTPRPQGGAPPRPQGLAQCSPVMASVPAGYTGAISSDTELYCRYIDHVLENNSDHEWAKVLKDWQCPLSLFAMRDPAVANDGRFYELKHIEAHNERSVGRGVGIKSPVTNEPMSSSVTLCPTVKAQMQAWVEADVEDLPGDTVIARLETALGVEPGTDLSDEGTRGVQPAPSARSSVASWPSWVTVATVATAERVTAARAAAERDGLPATNMRVYNQTMVETARDAATAIFNRLEDVRPGQGVTVITAALPAGGTGAVAVATSTVVAAARPAVRPPSRGELAVARARQINARERLPAMGARTRDQANQLQQEDLAILQAPPPPDPAPVEQPAPAESRMAWSAHPSLRLPSTNFLRAVGLVLCETANWLVLRHQPEMRDRAVRAAVLGAQDAIHRHLVAADPSDSEGYDALANDVLLFHYHSNNNNNHHNLLNDAMGYHIVPPPVPDSLTVSSVLTAESARRVVHALAGAVGEPSDTEDSGSDDEDMPGLVDSDSERETEEVN